MSDTNTATFDDNNGHSTETTVTTETVPGFFGNIWNSITNHKVITTLTLGVAAGGAGYYTYMKMRDGAPADEIASAVESLSAAAVRLIR